MKDLIGFVADRLCWGMDPADPDDSLKEEGLTEEEIFLTIKGGEIIAQARAKDRVASVSSDPEFEGMMGTVDRHMPKRKNPR